jgi:hypothetical protein
MRSRCCLCVCARVCVSLPIVASQWLGKSPLIVVRQRLGKNPPLAARQRLGKNLPIVARQRLGKNPFIVARQRLGKNPSIVAKQRLGRNVTAVTNTQAAIEELLDASFSMWPVSYQGKYTISSSQNFLVLFRYMELVPKVCPHLSFTLCIYRLYSVKYNVNVWSKAKVLSEHTDVQTETDSKWIYTPLYKFRCYPPVAIVRSAYSNTSTSLISVCL